ncbi:uncharacterized protein LOC131634688 [Vicia villosa]|uniref:uncharacterized protein LOC131634688 n=1 Tax=Vicia villosa TaxID=3911 RepID=UPI00273B7662|nr:uncharacterized protein LOC131634688 [Vicia villosa]
MRYVCPKVRIQINGGILHRSDDSIWWRDMCNINVLDEFIDNGFSGCFKCVCKDGKDILFWHNRWLGEQSLCFDFPDLYDLSTKKYCTVEEVIDWYGGAFRWKLEGLFSNDPSHGHSVTAAAVAGSSWARLRDCLLAYSPSEFASDTFVWSLHDNDEFTVASISSVIDSAKSCAWDYHVINSLKVMWDLKLPPKIKVFTWRLFIDRLPTRDNLLKRGVTSVVCPNCVMCGSSLESSSHIFFFCQEVKAVWNYVFTWLGIAEEISVEDFLRFEVIQEKALGSKRRIAINFVWIATLWCIWLMRNDMIFKGKVFSFEVVCTNIVFLSWSWLGCGYTKFKPNYYEWFKLPLSDNHIP